MGAPAERRADGEQRIGQRIDQPTGHPITERSSGEFRLISA